MTLFFVTLTDTRYLILCIPSITILAKQDNENSDIFVVLFG
jgi:hypothetical protein